MAPNRPQYGSIDEFRASKGAKWTPLQKFVEGAPPDAEAGVLPEVVMSAGSPDRAGDTVAPSGWKYRNFLNNPVLMWCHDYSQPPVGKVTSVAIEGDRFIGRRLVFVPKDVDAFGASVGAMYLHPERFLRMFSVGFQPEEADFNERTGGIDFRIQDLLELSACPIGMHPEALAAAKSARIDVEPWMLLAAKSLDGDRGAPSWMHREFATHVHKSLAPPAVQVPLEWKSVADALRAELATIRDEFAAFKATLAQPAPVIVAPSDSTPPASSPPAAPAVDARSVAEAVARSLSNHAARLGGNTQE